MCAAAMLPARLLNSIASARFLILDLAEARVRFRSKADSLMWIHYANRKALRLGRNYTAAGAPPVPEALGKVPSYTIELPIRFKFVFLVQGRA